LKAAAAACTFDNMIVALTGWEGVLVVVAAPIFGLFASTLGFYFRRPTPVEVRVETPPPAPAERPVSKEIVFVDYLNQGALEEIARQKNVPTGAITVEDEAGESESSESSVQSEIKGGLPGGLLSSGIKGTTAEAFERSRRRRRSQQYSYSTRTLIEQVIEALDRDGQLRRDVCDLPQGNESEGEVMEALIGVWSDWGIDRAPREMQDEDPRKKLADAIDVLLQESLERVTAAKLAQLRDLASSGTTAFALAATEWEVHETDGELVMVSMWLVDRDETEDFYRRAPAEDLVRVPLDRANLIGVGTQRLKPGASVGARVFGVVSTFNDGDQYLELIPLAVFATQR
jgi:hypothetical protein